MPKISVIMPAYNAEKYIAEAIDSILGQTFGDFEFIILNDCSKDRTEEIILSYDDPRIVYVKNEENMGVARTLNRGLDLAKGEFIARMDADDISLPERFAKQVAYMNRHKNCGICGSNTILFGERLTPSPFCFSKKNNSIFADMLFNSPFAHPSVMLRANILKKYNLYYDYAFERVEDYHLWYRLLQVSKGYNIQEPLLRYRMHPNQVTQAYKAEIPTMLTILKKEMMQSFSIPVSNEELAVFIQVCRGLRNLSAADYRHFISGGKKIISHIKTGKLSSMWIYASLNASIVCASGIATSHIVSWIDSIYKFFICIYHWRNKK